MGDRRWAPIRSYVDKMSTQYSIGEYSIGVASKEKREVSDSLSYSFIYYIIYSIGHFRPLLEDGFVPHWRTILSTIGGKFCPP